MIGKDELIEEMKDRIIHLELVLNYANSLIERKNDTLDAKDEKTWLLFKLIEVMHKDSKKLVESHEWKSIDSAPMDGTDVIVGVYIATVWITRSARYENCSSFCEIPSEIGWYSYANSVGQDLLEGIFKPTHWIPQPSDPEVKA
jgi:hypothetical protein